MAAPSVGLRAQIDSIVKVRGVARLTHGLSVSTWRECWNCAGRS